MRKKAKSEANDGYTVRKASRFTGVLPSTIKYWAGSYGGLIKAEVKDPGVRGAQKFFSLRNLIQIKVAHLLSEEGVPKAEIARILTRRRQDWFTPEPQPQWDVEWIFVAENKDTWKVESGGSGPGRPSFASSLPPILGEFEKFTGTWPDGWEPRADLDAHLLKGATGARRIVIINLGLVRQRIMKKAL